MIFDLVPETADILHAPVDTFDFASMGHEMRQELTTKLVEAMHHYRGIGLSANQVGLPYRLFVMHLAGDSEPTVCFNPEVKKNEEGSILGEEGCLSFPGLRLFVKRQEVVSVRFQDLLGDWVEDDLTGLRARCFLHELDHLDGITFTKRVSPLKLKMARAKLK